jgi:hypothetical protein
MASAAVGTKRSFATMNGDDAARMSIMQDASSEALASHLRHIINAEETRS